MSGTLRQWTDTTGAVLGVQSYGPFGEAREPVGAPPWGFTGEWQDPAGMVYLRARWYNPALGRFTQVDPVAGDLSAPASQHPYVYGLNSPLRYTDPAGRYVFEETRDDRHVSVPRPPVLPVRSPLVLPSDGASPLTPEQIAAARALAEQFSIPPEFLAGVLHAQRLYDYDTQDAVEDAIVKGCLLTLEQPMHYPVSPSSVSGAALALSLIAQVGRLSLGLGQIQIDTALRMESYFAESGLLCRSSSRVEVVAKLETDYGNIAYVAAYLRYLMDVRVSFGAAPLASEDLGSMQVIYGAYRAGIGTAYGRPEEFAAASKPGPDAVFGPLLTEEIVSLYR